MGPFEIAIGDKQNLSVARLMPDAHWQWLAKGWVDFKATWQISMVIGAVPVIAAWLMVLALWRADALGFIPAVCGGFALVGPILAIACYEISRQRASGEPITFLTLLRPKMASPGQIAIIGFVLMLILMIWARMASLLFALATSSSQAAAAHDIVSFALETPQGLVMIGTGTIIGGVLATIGYIISVVSLPLASDRHIDALTAMLISVVAVSRSKGALASFAFNIGVLIALSLATGFFALVFVFPWLGYATWHCYQSIVSEA